VNSSFYCNSKIENILWRPKYFEIEEEDGLRIYKTQYEIEANGRQERGILKDGQIKLLK
jgi:hypothetical protein